MANENFNADARRLTDDGNKCAERLNGANDNWKRMVNRPEASAQPAGDGEEEASEA